VKSARNPARALAAGALAALLVVTGCGRGTVEAEQHPPSASVLSEGHDVPLPGDFSGSGPGTLRSATKLPIVDRRITRIADVAARITYVSTSGIDGSPQTVSGSVFVPVGHAPDGGWQVIVFGHGSSGIEADCAPSLSPTFNGGVDSIRALLALGYVLVVPDYQGLGMRTGYHPYLDGTTEGYNIIDAARAVHKFLPDLSDKWVAFGVSQGGQAVWAANELNTKYSSPDLNLVGSVSVSPAADISGLVDLAVAGTLTPPQAIAMVAILATLKKEHPDFNLDDYRRGAVQKNWTLLAGCVADSPDKRLEVAKSLSPDDLRPSSPAAADQLRAYLVQMSGLPKVPASAPMLVVHGDQDQLIPVAWVEAAVRRACDMGDAVTSFVAIGRGHGDFDAGSALEWIQKRFAGAPPDSTCNAEGGPSIHRVPQIMPEILSE